jgi:hypothetical protein
MSYWRGRILVAETGPLCDNPNKECPQGYGEFNAERCEDCEYYFD